MESGASITLEEYERLPDDGTLYEIDEGRLTPVAFARAGRVRLQHEIRSVLARFTEERASGAVFVQAGYLLQRQPPTLRGPDVSFVRSERLSAMKEDEFLQGAPDLAIEIVSPSDSATQMARKVDQYLAAGAAVVWVVYPEARKIHVFRPDGSARVHGENDTIEVPDLLPGWSARLSSLLGSTCNAGRREQ